MPSDPPLTKHASVLATLRRLRGRFGSAAFAVVDRWESELRALGVAHPDEPRRLVHFCTHDRPRGRDAVELELPPAAGSDQPYSSGGWYEDVDFATLAALVAAHLGLADDGRASRPAV